jgi:hypothetical protein
MIATWTTDTTASTPNVITIQITSSDSTGVGWVFCRRCRRFRARLDFGEAVRCPSCGNYLDNGAPWYGDRFERPGKKTKPARSRGPAPIYRTQRRAPEPLARYRKRTLIPRRHQRHRRWK